ncbi:hypothetical protein HanRHA438_Chr05g0208331 [Helianthus annuus]|nr:hypothetical protein HanRHA438_Chr05g0208331 [Helianthus annuus]
MQLQQPGYEQPHHEEEEEEVEHPPPRIKYQGRQRGSDAPHFRAGINKLDTKLEELRNLKRDLRHHISSCSGHRHLPVSATLGFHGESSHK